jgi:hypothetical protein
MKTVFLANSPDGYKPTDMRPNVTAQKDLQREKVKSLAEYPAKKHTPGTGWHYVPAEPMICFNGSYWFVMRESSEGAILAHFKQICDLYGLDYIALQKEAYPDEEPQTVTAEYNKLLARPATIEDAEKVLDDLTDVNYHSLREALESKITLPVH